MIYVIMLEPVTAGNVGAVARVMKNFAFDKLVLVNPQCDPLCDEARNRAKHSQDILEKAEVVDFFIVDDYDYLIATTARLGTDYNISRSPLMPDELASKVNEIDPAKKIGLVIGREGHGMFNEEIEKCDFVVTIPSTPQYSTLNISHAVAVILYELHRALAERHVATHITPIGKPEKDQIMKMFAEIFDGWSFETAEKRETQEKIWRRVLGKSMLTRREAYGVMGFLRKVISERERAAAGIKLSGVAASAPKFKTAGAKKQFKGTIRKTPPAGTKRHEHSAKKGRGVAKAGGASAAKAKSKPVPSAKAQSTKKK